MVAEMGWIRLDRQIKNHWLWEEKPFDKKSAWIDLLLSANHENKKFLLGNELVEAKRGELVTSEVKLAERWGWSRCKVQTFLKLLADDRMILRKTDSKKTVLEIINYSKYQDINKDTSPKESEKTNSKKAGVRADSERVYGDCSTADYTATQQHFNSVPTATQQRSSTNNNDNNYNNINNYNKEREERNRFTPPTLFEVQQLCSENGYISNAKDFINYYESVGWVRGGNKIKDWKPVLEQWEQREKKFRQSDPKPNSTETFTNNNYSFDMDDINKLIVGGSNG